MRINDWFSKKYLIGLLLDDEEAAIIYESLAEHNQVNDPKRFADFRSKARRYRAKVPTKMMIVEPTRNRFPLLMILILVAAWFSKPHYDIEVPKTKLVHTEAIPSSVYFNLVSDTIPLKE